MLGPHTPSVVHFHTIELDAALLYVHWLRAGGIGLEGKGEEWRIVDEEEEIFPVYSII